MTVTGTVLFYKITMSKVMLPFILESLFNNLYQAKWEYSEQNHKIKKPTPKKSRQNIYYKIINIE